MSDKRTVYHPVFPGVTREVATEEQREAHKAAGWRMTPISTEKAEAPTKAAPKPTQRPPETNAAD